LLFGIESLWAVPLVEGLFVFAGVVIFMKILGIFDLITNK